MNTSKQKPNPFLAVRQSYEASQEGEQPNSAQGRKRTSAQSTIERKSSGQRLRVDLVRKIKVLAAQEGRHDYEVMEEALQEYLEKRSAL